MDVGVGPIQTHAVGPARSQLKRWTKPVVIAIALQPFCSDRIDLQHSDLGAGVPVRGDDRAEIRGCRGQRLDKRIGERGVPR